MPNLKKLLILNSLLWLLASCATPPPDVFAFKSLEPMMVIDESNNHLILEPSPACMEKINEVRCGYGVSIVTGREIFVGENPETFYNGKPWSQLKSESVYLPAVESYAPMAIYVINSCKKLKCDAEVNKFRIKFDGLTPDGKLIKEISDPQGPTDKDY